MPHLETHRENDALLLILAEIRGGPGDVAAHDLTGPNNGLPCVLDQEITDPIGGLRRGSGVFGILAPNLELNGRFKPQNSAVVRHAGRAVDHRL